MRITFTDNQLSKLSREELLTLENTVREFRLKNHKIMKTENETNEKQVIDAEFSKVKEALSMMQSDLRDFYSEEHRAKFDPIRKNVISMIEEYMGSLSKKSAGWG